MPSEKGLRSEPRYLICFDFPELNGDPVFAGDGIRRFTANLVKATRFESEASAERTLLNSYGPETRRWGCVVEVEQ